MASGGAGETYSKGTEASGRTLNVVFFLCLRIKNCLKGHHFEATEHIYEAVISQLNMLTHTSSNASNSISNGVLFLKEVALKKSTTTCKQVYNKIFYQISLITFLTDLIISINHPHIHTDL